MTLNTTTYDYATHNTGSARPGAKALMSWFMNHGDFLGRTNLGIFNPKRLDGGGWSIHAEGRACDFGHPRGSSWATMFAQELVECSQELGVQCVIHDRKIWSSQHPHSGFRSYSGSDPHDTHMHVELTRRAGESLTLAAIAAILTTGEIGQTEDIMAQLPTLQLGSTGYHVKVHQRLLAMNNYILEADGDFGPLTDRATRAYQETHSVPGSVTSNGKGDGIVGSNTWRSTLRV